MDVDLVAQINGTCTYSSPNLTCPIQAMGNGHVFQAYPPSNTKLYFSQTNTALDSNQYTFVSSTSTSVTVATSLPSSLPIGGVIGLPWVEAPNYGTAAGYNFTNLSLTNYSEANYQPCNGFTTTVCRTTFYMDGVRDYQNGFGFLNNVKVSYMDHAFWCVACQFMDIHALHVAGANVGIYMGPASGPEKIDSYQTGYEVAQDVWLDGAYNVKFMGQTHFRSGNSSNPQVQICNTSNGGALNGNVPPFYGAYGIEFLGSMFEYGEDTNTSLDSPPPAFLSLDKCSGALINTSDVTFDAPLFVNSPLTDPNNVPFAVRIGPNLPPSTSGVPYFVNPSVAFRNIVTAPNTLDATTTWPASTFTSWVESEWNSVPTRQPTVFLDDATPSNQVTGGNVGTSAICLSTSSGQCNAVSIWTAGGIGMNYRATTSGTATLNSGDGTVELANNFTLPAASGFPAGKHYRIINNTGNSYTITGAQNNIPATMTRQTAMDVTQQNGQWFMSSSTGVQAVLPAGVGASNQTGYATGWTVATVPTYFGIPGAMYVLNASTVCRAATAGASVAISMAYTDTSNTAQTVTGTSANCASLGTASTGGINGVTITAKAGTAIQLTTVNTGSPTYDFRAAATMISGN